MKHVFTATTMSADQEVVKGLLEEANIPCMIRNEQLAMALGELAPSDCSPEVWILNNVDYPRARAIVEALRNSREETLHVMLELRERKADSLTTRSVIQNQPTKSGFCAWRAATL
jgi:hypothetical protein